MCFFLTNNSKNIFLESAWFDPQTIRKTSLAQGLRTDAATRFEKGVDISNTVNVLKRAALLIKEIAGGEIAGELIDVYPNPVEQKAVALKYHYLKKLSGKNYHGDTVKNILTALGFEIIKEGMDEIWVNVPFSKPDITLQADIVEEIMRIDGLDNIEIPTAITLSPSADNGNNNMALKEKMANYLASIGFYEIFTNSITNSKYYNEETLQHSVKMINSLSADLDIMRPSMLQAGLEVTAYNINRKNNNLQLFEFGKTYHSQAIGQYKEQQHLSIFITGVVKEGGWQSKSIPADFFYLKAVCENIIKLTGKSNLSFETIDHPEFEYATTIKYNNHSIAIAGKIHQKTLSSFNIKEEVFYADIDWDQVVGKGSNTSIKYKEVAKFPTVQRDLALIVDKNITYNQVQTVVASAKINYLKGIKLFDVFESDKLGAGKKSMAINFNFSDDTKTLTDKEIDDVMNKLIKSFEKNIQAEIRK